MEIIDLYDNKKRKLNITMNRIDNVKKGQYKLSVHVWIMNSKGEILIQKRSDNKPTNPGKWGFTGGAVDTGETSLEAGIREVREELSIELKEEQIEFLLSFKRDYGFVDIYLARHDANIKDLVLQESEVAEAKWVSISEFGRMIRKDNVISSVKMYYDLLTKLLKRYYLNNNIGYYKSNKSRVEKNNKARIYKNKKSNKFNNKNQINNKMNNKYNNKIAKKKMNNTKLVNNKITKKRTYNKNMRKNQIRKDNKD